MTEAEAKAIAREAAREAVAMTLERLPREPVRLALSRQEVARLLGKSPRTIDRMNLPKNKAGKIPVQDALRAMEGKV